MKNFFIKSAIILSLTFTLAGCTVIFQKGRRSDTERIQQLSQQVDELSQAQKTLEDRLAQEIQDKQVKLERLEKGLVITVVGDLLFDSGKAAVRPEAYSVLDKVSKVLNENVPDFNVGIEGHTDNVPIMRSSWKSNWELSSARALSVLHYLVNNESVDPARLSAVGYGEYRPVESNDSKSGRQQNRRVEIVIVPKVTKVKEGTSSVRDSEENLK
ncbi:MAG: OmpA family protein [Candidatus Omnitrophica bacterium]|nr:OmpA family protein [Candidatus Omnitrophota bacterium]